MPVGNDMKTAPKRLLKVTANSYDGLGQSSAALRALGFSVSLTYYISINGIERCSFYNLRYDRKYE